MSNGNTTPDPIVKGMLREGETLIRTATIHFGIFWKAIALGVLAFFLLVTVFNLGILIAIVAGLAALYAFLMKYFLRLVLTDKRVLVRHGIINLDTVQLHHGKIESAETARTIMGRILGYSTLLITGTGSRVTAVPYVADADAFRAELDKMIFEREEKA